MLSWSARRRIIYFFIVLVFLGGIGLALAYFYRPIASCFDGKQNQRELGIDCGGPCAKVCSLEVAPLQVQWTRLFKVDEGKYDAAVFIKNPNPKHGTRSFRYIIKVWDKDGLLISTRRGAAYANPGEELVIYQNRIDVGVRVPKEAVFEFEENPTWIRFAGEVPHISVGEKAFINIPTPRLTVPIRNESLTNIPEAEAVAVLYDENQNAIAVNSTLVEQLAKESEQTLVYTWPKSFAESVAFIELYPHFPVMPQ